MDSKRRVHAVSATHTTHTSVISSEEYTNTQRSEPIETLTKNTFPVTTDAQVDNT
jgi:hypothetical protein